MRKWRIASFLCLTMLVIPASLLATLNRGDGQPRKRITAGNLKGFSLPHQVEFRVQNPSEFLVRSVQGTMLSPGYTSIATGKYVKGPPIECVLFEIRGPQDSSHIRPAETDEQGHFAIKGIPDGRYVFKTTCDQTISYYGIVVVSNRAPKDATIELELSVPF